MLSAYQDMSVPEYLDGRYFEKVMKSIDSSCVTPSPLIIRFMGDGTVVSNSEAFTTMYDYLAPHMYARMIIEVFDENNTVTMRHSQLLIIGMDSFIHFEPDQKFRQETDMYNTVVQIVTEIFEGYTPTLKVLTQEGISSETDSMIDIPGGYCVAYVLKYAYFHKLGQEVKIGDVEDIRQFSRTVEYLHGPLCEGLPDVEFGFTNSNDTLSGGLVGGGVGLALGGPAGALIGAGSGAFLGSRLGNR